MAARLPENDANRAILREAVIRLFDTAQRWSAIESSTPDSAAASIVDRMESLDRRIASAEDEVVGAQYRQAKEGLAEQLKHLKEIDTHRERVLARMHNYLAAVERLRMALVNLDSQTASAQAVAPIVSSLQEIGHDIDGCAEAMRDVQNAAH
jgi:hypothetical protein